LKQSLLYGGPKHEKVRAAETTETSIIIQQKWK